MSEVRFRCVERDGEGRVCDVVAELTLRPRSYCHSVVGECLEWQFFNETLGTILLRSATMYVSIDDDSRVFLSRDPNQPPFEHPDQVPVLN